MVRFCLVLCYFVSFGASAQNEVIYHVFERSFYDANGDGQGDLRGLRLKLDYLQDLGVTAVLLTPLYSSAFYHNYFADDFFKIDPSYGSMADFRDLVRDIHRRKMKIYLDMETQYVTDSNAWWTQHKDFLVYDDSARTRPSPIIFGATELKGYDGKVRKVAMVDLYNPGVLAFNQRLFGYFIAAGVDGFRLDHMMDDLDWKGRLTDLFTRFWAPLLASLRRIDPHIIFIAEQANWGSYGFEYFSKGTVDRVFAFRLAGAIQSFNKAALTAAADSTLALLPPGKEQVVFIENHDMDRFATRVGRDPGKERVGAALNLLLGGIPSIYYGQELGMFGSGGFNKFGVTDANDIPRREAFEWYASDTGRGMALWYKGSGAWWDSTNLKPFDGVSLEEEERDTASLWHYYVRLLALRRQYPALATGQYVAVSNPNPYVFTFFRVSRADAALVMVNLSPLEQRFPLRPGRRIFGPVDVLPPYGVEVSILKDKYQ